MRMVHIYHQMGKEYKMYTTLSWIPGRGDWDTVDLTLSIASSLLLWKIMRDGLGITDTFLYPYAAIGTILATLLLFPCCCFYLLRVITPLVN